jgi:hypothetical protein
VTNYWLCLVVSGFSCIEICCREIKSKVFIEIVIGLQNLIVYNILCA